MVHNPVGVVHELAVLVLQPVSLVRHAARPLWIKPAGQ